VPIDRIVLHERLRVLADELEVNPKVDNAELDLDGQLGEGHGSLLILPFGLLLAAGGSIVDGRRSGDGGSGSARRRSAEVIVVVDWPVVPSRRVSKYSDTIWLLRHSFLHLSRSSYRSARTPSSSPAAQ
jgi:hypothetical protein